MKAVMFDQLGGPEVLEYRDVPDPVAGAGEVVLQVKACSVNRTLDLEVREKGYFGVKLPHISGVDPAGVVTHVGPGVTGIRVGDRVAVNPIITCGECRLCQRGQENACLSIRVFGVHFDGGYAEFVRAPAKQVIHVPATLSFSEAAALPLSYAVAWQLLVPLGQVSAQDTVLIQAAGSGIGVAGLQIAKLKGARVIAAAGSDEKLERARALGADLTVNYATADLSQEVKRLTDGWGADLVFENIGAAMWDRSLACLAKKGRLVTCGTHGGSQASIDIRALYLKANSLLFSLGATRRDVEEVFRLAGEGKLKAVIDRTFPLREAAAAQEYLSSRKNFGKIILIP